MTNHATFLRILNGEFIFCCSKCEKEFWKLIEKTSTECCKQENIKLNPNKKLGLYGFPRDLSEV